MVDEAKLISLPSSPHGRYWKCGQLQTPAVAKEFRITAKAAKEKRLRWSFLPLYQCGKLYVRPVMPA